MGSGENLEGTLGTTPIDIDHDWWIDVIYNGIWFRNPGILSEYPDTPWKSFLIKAGGHDAITADMDLNGEDDILIYDGNKIAWYNTSNSLRENVISSGHHDHGGTAPKGFGDIDGDGDIDVMIPGFWYENTENGTGAWVEHEWPFMPVDNASYGPSIRAWITDIDNPGWHDAQLGDVDGDGDTDIVSKVWNADGLVYHLDFWKNQYK